MAAALHVLRPQIPATLAAARIGAWEYEIPTGRCFLDKTMSSLLNLPERKSRQGIPIQWASARVSSSDRMVADDGCFLVQSRGGLFSHILHYFPSAGVERVAISHGSAELNEVGETVYASGIMVDITERASDDPRWPSRSYGDDKKSMQLGQAIDAVLSAHQAIKLLGSAARPSLLHITELLLHELGMQLAGEMR